MLVVISRFLALIRAIEDPSDTPQAAGGAACPEGTQADENAAGRRAGTVRDRCDYVSHIYSSVPVRREIRTFVPSSLMR